MAGPALITGATGFVGSHIAEAFLKAGYETRCAVRDPGRPRWLSGLPVESVTLDLDRPANLPRALEGVDTVVHAAGITRARRPEDYDRVNALGTRRLAAAARDGGVRRFVFISSLAARGPDGYTHPTSSYGWSKRKAESLLRGTGHRMEVVVLRPAAVYGPRDTDLLPLFALAKRGWLIVPSGPGLLQPAYAPDVAGAALAAADGPDGGGMPLPVAGPTRYSWKQVIRALEQSVGREVRVLRLPAAAFELGGRAAELVAGLAGAAPVFDRRRSEDLAGHTWTCDASEAEEALGWRAEVPLDEGLERTARWYESRGWI
ncbi:MAG: NAD-dependent epimerase/dehydratase family protein [Rubrobacteraceae bacterium]